MSSDCTTPSDHAAHDLCTHVAPSRENRKVRIQNKTRGCGVYRSTELTVGLEHVCDLHVVRVTNCAQLLHSDHALPDVVEVREDAARRLRRDPLVSAKQIQLCTRYRHLKTHMHHLVKLFYIFHP